VNYLKIRGKNVWVFCPVLFFLDFAMILGQSNKEIVEIKKRLGQKMLLTSVVQKNNN